MLPAADEADAGPVVAGPVAVGAKHTSSESANGDEGAEEKEGEVEE